MKNRHLDAISRSLTFPGSRRGMVALGIAGLLSLTHSVDAAEKRGRPGRCARVRCVECTRCKRGRCLALPDGTACSNGGECRDGRCQR